MLPIKRDGPMIPASAVEIKIVHRSSPFFMIGYDVKEHSNISKDLGKNLNPLVNKYLKKQNPDLVKNGTTVIVRGNVKEKIQLPAWWCRGVVCTYDDEKKEYVIFLTDYGVKIHIIREFFVVVPKEEFRQPYLAFIFSLNNILPATLHTSKNENEMVVEKKWSPEALKMTTELLSASRKIFFDHIATDKDGKKYGELYLLINGQVVPLRKALVHSYLAIYLSPKILSVLKNKLSSKNVLQAEEDIKIEVDNLAWNPDDSKSSIFNELVDDNSEAPDSNDSSLISKAEMSGEDILIVSNSQCKRLSSLAGAKFTVEVHKQLADLNFRRVMVIQSYVWPAIGKGLDVLAIGPARCGKTLSYVAPIASLIANTRMEQFENYPMALVLCAKTDDVIAVAELFTDLLKPYDKVGVVSAYNARSDKSLAALIFNGCHIFVTTAPFLLRYYERDESHVKCLNLKYLRYLIVDRVDLILAKHKDAFTEVMKKFTPVGRRMQNLENTTIQIIAVAEKWSTQVGQFAGLFSEPYTCITSYPDAVICSGIRPTMRLIRRDRKAEKIEEILGRNHEHLKTVIVCAKPEESEKLNEVLSENYKVLYVHKEMIMSDIKEMKEIWNSSVSGMYPVLICTDDVLSDLRITDADWLIHYSVDTRSKTVFHFRFSTLMSKLQTNKKKFVSIFIDETNDKQFEGVTDLVVRAGGKLSDEHLKKIEKVCANWDRKKKGYSLCDQVKAIGSCTNFGRCPFRHFVLPEVDSPKTLIEVGDRIKFTVTAIHGATHFSARIYEHIDKSNKIRHLDECEHVRITSQVHRYLCNQKNRETVRNVEVGDIYGYDEGISNFKRVQITHIVDRDKVDAVLHVAIRMIDSGVLRPKVRVSRMLKLPEELATAPTHIVEILLANIVPYDDEEVWSNAAGYCTSVWQKKNLSSESFLQGKVCLHLGNTFWVDPLEVRTKIIGRGDMLCASLKNHLIQSKHGISDDHHIDRLRKLCHAGGLTERV